jgi:hypothetical protein
VHGWWWWCIGRHRCHDRPCRFRRGGALRLADVDPQRLSYLHCRLGLLEVEQVRRKRNEIAASGAGSEVGPPAGGHIHLEAAFALIGARGVDCDPLGALALAVGQPPLHEHVSIEQRVGSDALEGDLARGGHAGAQTPIAGALIGAARAHRLTAEAM